jgi:hypothetical protein
MGIFLTLAWSAAVLISLWCYFGFLYFDLAEFKQASLLRKIWGMFVAFVVPLCALTLDSGNPKRIVLAGIGVTAILVPVIVPDADPPEAHSISNWIYLHTIGTWFADLFMSMAIYLLAFVCSLFGQFWLYAYAAIAVLFATSRSLWVRMQRENLPKIAGPSALLLPLVFTFVFSWVGFIFSSINNNPNGAPLSTVNWQTDFNELYKPELSAALIGWCLVRWPWLGQFKRMRFP